MALINICAFGVVISLFVTKKGMAFSNCGDISFSLTYRICFLLSEYHHFCLSLLSVNHFSNKTSNYFTHNTLPP
ncbi:MAG: hypothetical protein FWG20_06845, partial [Candidatus Cloacimonetes bacterium]|nr:hypothetical protein [Candidatus Cloacimonadota bacterium]